MNRQKSFYKSVIEEGGETRVAKAAPAPARYDAPVSLHAAALHVVYGHEVNVQRGRTEAQEHQPLMSVHSTVHPRPASSTARGRHEYTHPSQRDGTPQELRRLNDGLF